MQKPTTNCVNATNNEMRAWFPMDREEGECLTLSHRGNPSKLSTTHFLSFSPIIYFCQKLVQVVIAWEWEEYGKNSNWEEHPFWKNVFWLPWQVKTQKRMPILPCILVFLFLAFLELLVILHSHFWQCSSFFPWLGSGFVNIQWLGSVLGVFVLFLHSHD